VRTTHHRVEACDIDGEVVDPYQRPPASEVSEAVQLARKVDPKRLYVDVSNVCADLGIGAEDGIGRLHADLRLSIEVDADRLPPLYGPTYIYNNDAKSRSLPITKINIFNLA